MIRYSSPASGRLLLLLIAVALVSIVWLEPSLTLRAASAPGSVSSPPARPVHWSYEGEDGPAHWGGLSPAYSRCAEGKMQSPIDLIPSQESNAIPLIFDYKRSSLRIAHHEHVVDLIDNGHTIQVTVDRGSTLTTRRAVYHLAQFHFHSPSEHTVDGKAFPLEAHFVHQSESGNFAVVGVLFEEGAPNPNLESIIAHFPAAKGETRHEPSVELDLGIHLPVSPLVYSYRGSFTTPPCTENVEWFVLKAAASASREQLAAFATRLQGNNRPVQSPQGRKAEFTRIRERVAE